jgi:hypothetical protein
LAASRALANVEEVATSVTTAAMQL